MKIIETNLSLRVKNTLRRNGIHTVDELKSKDIDSIKRFRHMGDKSIEEIIQFLSKFEKNKIIKEISRSDIEKNILGIEMFNLSSLLLNNPHRDIESLIKEEIDDVKEIKFIDGFKLAEEIDISNFSIRVTRIATEINLNNINTLLKFSIDRIRDVRNIGEKSYREILEKIIEDIIVLTGTSRISNFDSLFAYLLVLDLKIYIDHQQSKEIYYKLKKYSEKMLLGKLYNLEDLEVNRNKVIDNIDESLIEELDLSEQIIERILKTSQVPLNVVSIKNQLPQFLKHIDITKYVNILKKKDKIKFSTEGFEYKNPSIVNVIDNKFDKKKATIIKLRLEGYTLEEIATYFDFTRERARQIIAKEIVKINQKVLEERYHVEFEKYDIDKRDFINIFDISEIEYNYLNIIFNRGTKNLEEMLTDGEVEEAIRMRVKAKLDKGYIILGDNKIKINRLNIIRYLVKIYAEEEIDIWKIYEVYNEFVESQNLNRDELKIDIRYLENRIADSKFAISLPGKKVRFFKFEDYDWNRFYEEVNIEKYIGKEITTLLIYREQTHLMKMYDIRNEYELHNIMKKVKDVNKSELEFGRNPTVRVGKTNRTEQVLTLFLTHTPIKAIELAKLYEEEYGVKKQTAQATHFRCIQQYLYNGEYLYENVELNPKEITIIEEVLSNLTLHFIEDFKDSLLSKQISESRILEIVTPITMERFGYRVYSSYLLSFQYTSMSEYIEKVIFNQNIVDLNKQDKRIYNIGVVWSKIRDYVEKLEFIEFDNKKYIHIKKLEEVGLSKQYFKGKLEQIYENLTEDIISLESIKNYFDDSNVNDFGFNDIFFISLLRSHENIYYQKIGGGYILRKNNSDVRVINVIDMIVNQYKIIDIYDLIDFIHEEFAIQLEKYKIIEIIKDTEIYYDEIMERVYSDEGYYYEEFDD